MLDHCWVLLVVFWTEPDTHMHGKQQIFAMEEHKHSCGEKFDFKSVYSWYFVLVENNEMLKFKQLGEFYKYLKM